MRRYQAASYRGRWFIDHDTPRVSRQWVNWLLRELGIRPQYGRPRKRAAVACNGESAVSRADSLLCRLGFHRWRDVVRWDDFFRDWRCVAYRCKRCGLRAACGGSNWDGTDNA